LREVGIIGIGCTKVGEHWGTPLRDLFAEAALKALDDSGLEKIESLYVGNMLSAHAQKQEHLGALMADNIGISGVQALKVEAACGSGGMAIHEGFKAVASGLVDFVMVGGVEKMTDISTPEVTMALMMAENREYSAFSGITFVGLNALCSRLYMETYEVKPEEMMAFPVNDHNNAVNNPHAQYPFKITVERAMQSAMVADPIHLYECCGIGDGAAAVILCPLEIAKKLEKPVIEVSASTTATNVLNLYERDDLLDFAATRNAVNQAYAMANISKRDVDVLEVHDAFSVVGVLSLEALGFAERGMGARFAAEGKIALDGEIPTNTMGGLKARGHPIGATGVYEIVELAMQLRGEAGKNQVEDAEVGLTQNVGGVDSTAIIHVLRRR
jgi:acetyl-CoA C-acetyltransferase